MKAAEQGSDVDEMEWAYCEAEAAGIDSCILNRLAPQCRRIRAEARLKAAEQGSDVNEMAEACFEAVAAGVDESRQASIHQKMKRILAEARLKAAEQGSEAVAVRRSSGLSRGGSSGID